MMQASSARAAGSARYSQRPVASRVCGKATHVAAVGSRSWKRLDCYAQSSIATVVVTEPLKPVAAPEPVPAAEPTAMTVAEAAVALETTTVETAAEAAPAVPVPEEPKFKTVKQLRLRSSAAYLPHVNKESYGGEDAHFISNISGGAIGVADGVGGWAESGINPAEYSRTLMRVACAYIEGADTRSVATASITGSMESSPCASLSSVDNWSPDSLLPAAAVVDPRAALDAAHKLTKLPGSATACVVQLCPEKKNLIAANLGDSGFIIVRDSQIALRSSPKQHFFDCPLQFGSFPDHVDGTDTADDAEIFHFSAQPGDVIVAGSDGLWDNVYNKELLELIPKSAEGVDDAADKIARLARRHAADPEFASPYTAEAKAQGLDWPLWMKVINTKIVDGKPKLGQLTGGKMDDITVLVAMVEETDVLVPVDGSSGSSADAAAARPAAAAAAGIQSKSSTNGAPAAAPAASAAATNGSSNGSSPAAEPVVAAAQSAASSNASSSSSTVSATSNNGGGGAAAAVVVDSQSSGPNMLVAGTAVVLGAFTLVMQFIS